MAVWNKRALRGAWLQVHKWIALALMILLMPLGLSGVVLAWDDAIDHQINPQRYAVSGTAILPPSAYLAVVRRALGPDDRITTLRYPGKDGGPVTIGTSTAPADGDRARQAARKPGVDREADGRSPQRRMTLWLDPPSARLLDRNDVNSGLIRIAHNFHGNLLVPMPGVGRAVVGLLGVAMFLLAASGLWLWWPPIGQWTAGLRWQRGDRRTDTNLHHRIGFWIALPLAAQAFTGAWIAWPQMIALAGNGATNSNRAKPAPISTPHLDADAALAAAQRVKPGVPLSITWPAGPDRVWQIMLAGAAKPTLVRVDDVSGTATADGGRERGGIALAVRQLHDGTTLGFVWRLVMVMIGLAPTLLGITGLLMWLRSRRWRSPKAKRKTVKRERVVA